VKVLFIPCYHDGLPRETGSARIRCDWVARHWPGAEIMDGSQRLAGFDAYVFQKAYLTEKVQEWIATVARWRDMGACRLALDLCDPDFLQGEHAGRLLDVLPLFDFAVAPTPSIAGWLSQWLPAHVVPDRVDLAEVAKIGAATPRDTDRPRLVWAGYGRNMASLTPLLPAARELGLELDVLAFDRPLPFADFWRRVAGYDVLLNPRPRMGPLSYKSDNKTLVAWALGLPVACTPRDLEILLDPEQRRAEGEHGRRVVREDYDARLSAADWQRLFGLWGVN
jgi:hypothetical protein